jgi:hypothetical protein
MFRKLMALPTALLGVLLAHEGAYRLVEGDSEKRGVILEHTGHGWLSLIPSVAAIFFIFAAWNAWRVASSKSRKISFGEILATQITAYFTIEFGERLVSGHAPWPGLEILLAGISVQVPAALVVWALLYYVLIPTAELVLSFITYFTLIDNSERVVITQSKVNFSNRRFSTVQGRAPPLTR